MPASSDVLTVADRLWRGELSTGGGRHLRTWGGMAEVADGVAFAPSFANVSAFDTDDGLLLVDTGSALLAGEVHRSLRTWSASRLHTAIYSHGHIDHVFGVPVWEAEASERGWPAPTVVSHEALPARFDRYVLTAGYNGIVNRRQFGIDDLEWPVEYRYPDTTYRDHLTLEVGELCAELHHAEGETDDHTWTWIPDRRVLCCGDLFIWASPNAGNPQKVQRYPLEWANALREMLALFDRPGRGPEVLLPGHGFPVVGGDRIRQALADTAELLESLVAQTLHLMNQGARLDEIVHTVQAPARLMERPYLQPVYDEPEFVVQAIWRRYGGWWDGNPASLKPAPERALATELAELAGGARALADRAQDLLGQADGDGAERALRLAGHLAELAWQAAPDDPGIRRVRQAVFAARADGATSTMARGVFSWAARESGAPGPGHVEEPTRSAAPTTRHGHRPDQGTRSR